MPGQSPKFTSDLWKKLIILGQQQGSIRLNDLALEMKLSPEETLSYLREIFPHGVGTEIYQGQQECMVDLDAQSLQYMLPLSPAEWMQLHELLAQSPEKSAHPVISSLKRKVLDNGPIKVVMDLLNQLEFWDQHLNEQQQDLLARLDSAIENQRWIQICSYAGKIYNVFPCRVVHLEGKLSLVAEDSQDHCLIITSLHELQSVSLVEHPARPRVSPHEVEEFITAIRNMNEKEARLILKIHDPQSANLFPNYHFLGKPCMVTNPAGDLIWAAYVEPCDALYEWLISLGASVEILDPVSFRQDFLIYCEEKVRRIA